MAGSEPDPERETSSTHRGAPLSSALGETTAEPPRPNSPSEARTQTSCQESSLPSSTQGPKSLPAQGLFGRYELLGDVNQGGMGIVYKARDTALGRVVALKMLKTGTLADQEEVKRFYREARAVAKLKHPHIVPIYDVGQHQGLHYFTMEYVPGGTVASHLTRFQADIAAAVGLMEKVARAVQYAHQNGILHRDLKPTNILIDENGEPRVSDLGLAKLFYAEGELLPPEDENAGAVLPPVAEKMPLPAETLSQVTGIVGTPPYMSPEQVAGQRATGATDIWALGSILYELLTGQPPFDGQDRTELFHKIRSEPAVPPRQRRPAIDAKLERICLRCLEKEPTKRPASAGALAQDLHRWLQSESWAGRLWQPCHQHPILAIATGIIAVTLIALAVVRSRPDPDRPMREQQRRLVGGESVVLIGEKERPRWFRWGLGEAAIKQSSLAAGFFALDSSTPCLMELLPTVPGDGYRFKAEVRHEYSAFGEVGIAFAFTRRELSPDADAYFFALTFNDQEALIKPSKATQRCSQVSLSLRRSGQPDFLKSVQLLWKNYAPPLRTASAPWRQLVVRVAADNIEAFWEGKSIGLIRPADIARALHTLDGEMAGPESFPLSATGFPHRAAVGLFLKGGTASFQQVTVEPLR